MHFRPTRLDLPALITTLLVSILLVGLSAFFLTLPYGWIFSIIMLLFILVSYLFSPAKYYLTGSHLIVQKVIGRKIVIPLVDVVGYTIVPDFSKLKVVRTFGNGGLFGYYGTFSTAEYGMVNCQLRSLKRVIILKTKNALFAISPAEVERLKDQLTATVLGLSGTMEELVPTPAWIVKRANVLVLILPVVIFLLTVVLISNAYLHLPERIAVHFDLHGNPDGWASRASFIASSFVPAAILCVLSIGIFLAVRRATRQPTLPYLLVIMLGVFQLFTAYISYDTYWVNRNNTHLVPFPYNIIIYFLIIAVLLVVFYRKTRSSA
jgi:hypothetical protein